MVARLLCHPLDTAKARLQGPAGGSFRNTWHVLRTTMAAEGIGGLYRGIGAVMVGGVPGMCLYLTTYEATKGFLTDGEAVASDGSRAAAAGGMLTHLTAGMLAEVVCCVVFVPVDVVKERLQVQRTGVAMPSTLDGVGGGGGVGKAPVPPYRGSADTLKTILRTEGLRGIYKGYLATLASFGPFSALYFMFYEQAKAASQTLIERQPSFSQKGANARAQAGPGGDNAPGGGKGKGELPVWATLANAAGASALASWLTNPLDLAKLRLQVQRGTTATARQGSGSYPAAAAPYSGMTDALRRSYRVGGLAGLFKGSGARMAFQAPSVAITMAAFEKGSGRGSSSSSSSSSARSSPGEVEVREEEGEGLGVTGGLAAEDAKPAPRARRRRAEKAGKKEKEKSVMGRAGDALKATFNAFMAASTVVSLALAAEAIWQLHGTQLTLSNAVPTLTKLIPLTGIGVFGAAQLVGLVARVVRVIVTLPIMLSGTWVILQNAPKLLPQGSDLGGAGSLAALLATPEVLEAAAVVALLGGTVIWALNFATGAVGALMSGRDELEDEEEDELA
eukprot:g13082.t1